MQADDLHRGGELHGLGAALGARAWSALLAAGTPRRYQAGSVLIRQGDPPTHVLALVAGRVMVSSVDADGNELPLAVRGPGEVLGDISVLDEGMRSATVVALDRCQAHVIPGTVFRRFLDEEGRADLVVRHALVRLRENERIRAELAAQRVPQRLALLLLRLADGRDGAAVTLPDISQERLGQMIGASRNAVVSALAELRAAGIVETRRKRLVIEDMTALRAYAGHPPVE